MDKDKDINITIHRGTHQIGGCVTEICTDEARIIIDMGSELPGNESSTIPIEIDGVTSGKPKCDAIFFTHYHGDHIGMFDNVLSTVPLFMGEAAKEIFLALQTRLKSPNIDRIKNIQTFKIAKPIFINDIKVTPFSVDHSAYDSYMFLIECGCKRILHTGDFRKHGFRGKALIPMMEKHIGKVDVLISEGTMLSRKSENIITEHELSMKARDYIKNNKYVFVLCSSTNIDRIAAVYSATPRGKYFICDAYQREVLDVVQNFGSKHSKLYSFEKALVYGANLQEKMEDRGFCMLVRATDKFKKIIEDFDSNQSIILYSLWKGYLNDNSSNISSFLEGKEYEYLHTSGHATTDTIAEVIEAVSPKIGVIPIHSMAPKLISTLGGMCNTILLEDGETFSF